LEALLFASAEPVSLERLADILALSPEEVLAAISVLQTALQEEQRGLLLLEVAGGYQLCSKPYYFPWIEKLNTTQEARFSNAAMECLAIIAMKQPVTKQEIEQLRGVNSDRVVSTLLDKGLIEEAGRKEVVGRPILYGTTAEFLKCFGLRSLNDFTQLSLTEVKEVPVSSGEKNCNSLF